MPTLIESLQGRDPGYLRIVAELWGIELAAPDARLALQQLVQVLFEGSLITNGVASLPAGAREALDDLYQNDGRLPWALFTRRYGAVREMGAGRRDRERPYLKSPSPAEVLWYRALVGRTFFDTETGAQEFAFIPHDLLAMLPLPRDMVAIPLGRPAVAAERAHLILADDAILDHACTLLAAFRLGLPLETQDPFSYCSTPLSTASLQLLLYSASLLDENGVPRPEPVRAFLEAGRGEALAHLASAWLNSALFNDLRLVPGLEMEGEWQNDPLQARRALLDFLSTIPGGSLLRKGLLQERKTSQSVSEARSFWNMDAFIAAIREKHPDFQRQAGDYDSWFIRDGQTGEFLRGFEHWEQVDGALIRFILTGPMHWLGMLDLAAPASDARVTAFRFSDWASALLQGAPPEGMHAEDEAISAASNGLVRISRYAPRAVRYQVARFCAWEGEKEGVYRYRLAPASLAKARQQGLTMNHLFALLGKHAPSMPPSLSSALRRWEQNGTEARLEQVLVLRLSSPDLLQKLRNSRAARFLGDPLGPAVVVVKPGAGQKVLDILAEMGYLGEVSNLLHE
jgi:hypothetical protein